jgi:hypothetical protein
LEKRLWHSRLGHLGESQLDGLLATQVEGVALSVSEKLGFCETCDVYKSHVRRISRESVDRNVDVFEVLILWTSAVLRVFHSWEDGGTTCVRLIFAAASCCMVRSATRMRLPPRSVAC